MTILVPARAYNFLQATGCRRGNLRTMTLGNSVGGLDRSHCSIGDFTRNKLPQANSEAVNIGIARIGFMTNHFGRHVSVSPRFGGQLLPVIVDRHAKVCDLGTMIACKQNIGWLEVPMDHAFFVEKSLSLSEGDDSGEDDEMDELVDNDMAE